MDPYSIYVEDLPKDTTYNDLKDTFCKFQRRPPLDIVKKQQYVIITFQSTKTAKKILKKNDQLAAKGKPVTIKEADNKIKPTHIYLPPSFRLPVELLFPPSPPLLFHMPPFFIAAPPPPTPPPAAAPVPPPAPSYEHPFPEGFSYFFYK